MRKVTGQQILGLVLENACMRQSEPQSLSPPPENQNKKEEEEKKKQSKEQWEEMKETRRHQLQ